MGESSSADVSGRESTSEKNISGRPTPDNFYEYIPWACTQLQAEFEVNIIKVQSTFGSGKKEKNSMKDKQQQQSKYHLSHTDTTHDEGKKSYADDENAMKIIAVYDTIGNIQQIKFEKNKNIPILIFQILRLILPYHLQVTKLTINKGLNNESLYGLSKLLTASITELCLDGTDVNNYDVLLENNNVLTNLSLSRCNIDDEMAMKIAEKLSNPLPASKSLALLYLASNKITDEGAKCIAEALRSNRRLAYLNLTDNLITDEGAVAILNILEEFQLTCDELKASKSRLIKYYRNKHESVSQFNVDNVADDKKTGQKRKLNKSATTSNPSGKKGKLVDSLKTVAEFDDPFSPQNTFTRDNLTYCFGNNRLAYINLSYNNISYFTVKKLLNILKYQKHLDRKPMGLVNVAIEGNHIPVNCLELREIEDILKTVVVLPARKNSTMLKKKPKA